MGSGVLMDVTTIGTPVVSSRQWCYALAPQGGDWDFICQCWELHNVNPTEWIVIRNLMTTPVQTNFSGPSGNYGHQDLTITTQLRAANGKIFFPAFGLYVFYYDPGDRGIHQLGPVVETPPVNPNASTAFFTHQFGPDGRLYMGTQESQNRSPMIVVLDPTTLAITILGYVGSNSLVYTVYAYYIQADTATSQKWIYVAVGQSPWQLWALSIDNGTKTKLFEVPAGGNIAFQVRTEGIVATIDSHLGFGDNVRTQLWCVDGTTYTYTAGYNPASLPFTPRSCTPSSNPITTPPQVDATQGAGLVKWRPNGSSGAYTNVQYDLQYATPVDIESLIGLSDGTVLGNVEQYLGFFRHNPGTGSLDWYGNWTNSLSQGPRIQIGQYVWFAGYPNGKLYRYDPSAAWNPPTNPLQFSNYDASGMKYANYFAYVSATGRLYCLGTRERDGQGCGIGYYDIAHNSFGGTFANLNFLDVSGLASHEDGRVILSGNVIDDPLFPGQTPTTAQLVIYDWNLNELERRTVIPNLLDTGWIAMFTGAGQHILFGINASGLIYSYDFDRRAVTGTKTYAGMLNAVARMQAGSSDEDTIYAVIDTTLYRIHPYTLAMESIGNVGASSWLAELPVTGHSSRAPAQTIYAGNAAVLTAVTTKPAPTGHRAKV